jgi:hypothetical protein
MTGIPCFKVIISFVNAPNVLPGPGARILAFMARAALAVS